MEGFPVTVLGFQEDFEIKGVHPTVLKYFGSKIIVVYLYG